MKTAPQKGFSFLKKWGVRLLCLSGLSLMVHCKSDGADPNGVPSQLLTGWIWPISSLSVRTYDFTQLQSNGKRTVELRTWQKIGTLGWQSNQLYSYTLFEVANNRLSMTTASGYQENWQIKQFSGTAMDLESLDGRGSVTWYNCQEPGWPELIHNSTRACQ